MHLAFSTFATPIVRAARFLRGEAALVLVVAVSWLWGSFALSDQLPRTLEAAGALVFWPFIAAIWALYGLSLLVPAHLAQARLVSFLLVPAFFVTASAFVFAYYYPFRKAIGRALSCSPLLSVRLARLGVVGLLYFGSILSVYVVFWCLVGLARG